MGLSRTVSEINGDFGRKSQFPYPPPVASCHRHILGIGGSVTVFCLIVIIFFATSSALAEVCALLSTIIVSYTFYRSTLCACFAVARCPSVCLSVTLMYCDQKAEDIVKLTSRPGIAPLFCFLDPQRRRPIPGGTLQRGRKIHGRGEILRFSTEIAVYLGNGTR